jgi:hypothetical protein
MIFIFFKISDAKTSYFILIADDMFSLEWKFWLYIIKHFAK